MECWQHRGAIALPRNTRTHVDATFGVIRGLGASLLFGIWNCSSYVLRNVSPCKIHLAANTVVRGTDVSAGDVDPTLLGFYQRSAANRNNLNLTLKAPKIHHIPAFTNHMVVLSMSWLSYLLEQGPGPVGPSLMPLGHVTNH
jgi:hypothetical protein